MTSPTSDDVLIMLREVFTETMLDRDLVDDDTPLIGPDAQVDSMELVSYIADVEEAIYERWRRDVVLADERALSRSRSPFRNLSALSEYVVESLSDG